MAEVVLSIVAERWNDIVILQGASAAGAPGADSQDIWTPPSGIGDLALMELAISASALATMVAANDLLGAWARVINKSSSAVADIIGVMPWYEVSATQLQCYLSPDPLVLIRRDEKIQISIPELDTNVSPTGVFAVYAKCVRVNTETVGTQPIQLVR